MTSDVGVRRDHAGPAGAATLDTVAAVRWRQPRLAAELAQEVLAGAATSGDAELWLRAAGWMLHGRSAVGDAREAALDLLDDLDTRAGHDVLRMPGAARLRVELAALAQGSGDPDVARDLLSQWHPPGPAAPDDADELELDRLAVLVRCALLDDADDLDDLRDEVRTVAARMVGEPAALAELLTGSVHRAFGEPAEAADCALRGLAHLGWSPDSPTSAPASPHIGCALLSQWVTALLEDESAAEIPDGVERLEIEDAGRHGVLWQLSLARAFTGRARATAGVLEDAAAGAAAVDAPSLEAACRAAQAELHENVGRFQDALEAMRAAMAAERTDRDRARNLRTALAGPAAAIVAGDPAREPGDPGLLDDSDNSDDPDDSGLVVDGPGSSWTFAPLGAAPFGVASDGPPSDPPHGSTTSGDGERVAGPAMSVLGASDLVEHWSANADDPTDRDATTAPDRSPGPEGGTVRLALAPDPGRDAGDETPPGPGNAGTGRPYRDGGSGTADGRNAEGEDAADRDLLGWAERSWYGADVVDADDGDSPLGDALLEELRASLLRAEAVLREAGGTAAGSGRGPGRSGPGTTGTGRDTGSGATAAVAEPGGAGYVIVLELVRDGGEPVRHRDAVEVLDDLAVRAGRLLPATGEVRGPDELDSGTDRVEVVVADAGEVSARLWARSLVGHLGSRLTRRGLPEGTALHATVRGPAGPIGEPQVRLLDGPATEDDGEQDAGENARSSRHAAAGAAVAGLDVQPGSGGRRRRGRSAVADPAAVTGTSGIARAARLAPDAEDTDAAGIGRAAGNTVDPPVTGIRTSPFRLRAADSDEPHRNGNGSGRPGRRSSGRTTDTADGTATVRPFPRRGMGASVPDGSPGDRFGEPSDDRSVDDSEDRPGTSTDVRHRGRAGSPDELSDEDPAVHGKHSGPSGIASPDGDRQTRDGARTVNGSRLELRGAAGAAAPGTSATTTSATTASATTASGVELSGVEPLAADAPVAEEPAAEKPAPELDALGLPLGVTLSTTEGGPAGGSPLGDALGDAWAARASGRTATGAAVTAGAASGAAASGATADGSAGSAHGSGTRVAAVTNGHRRAASDDVPPSTSGRRRRAEPSAEPGRVDAPTGRRRRAAAPAAGVQAETTEPSAASAERPGSTERPASAERPMSSEPPSGPTERSGSSRRSASAGRSTGSGPAPGGTDGTDDRAASPSRSEDHRSSRNPRRSGRTRGGRDVPPTAADPTAIPDDLGLGDLLAGALAAYRDI